VRGGCRARIDRLEEEVLVTDRQLEYERLRRFHFNLYRVSDAALVTSFASTLEGADLPAWAADEFARPIPAGVDRGRIREAEERARQELQGDGLTVPTEVELGKQVVWLLDRAAQAGFQDLWQYAESLRERDKNATALSGWES
jgi:hypothetical protein